LGGFADEIHVVQVLVLILCLAAAVGGCADAAAGRARLRHRFRVFDLDSLEALRLDKQLEVGDRLRRPRDLKYIGAEVRDLGFDVDIGALDDCDHRDQRGDTHGQAKDGKQSAHSMRTQRKQAFRNVVI